MSYISKRTRPTPVVKGRGSLARKNTAGVAPSLVDDLMRKHAIHLQKYIEPLKVSISTQGGTVIVGDILAIFRDGLTVTSTHRIAYLPLSGIVSVTFDDPGELGVDAKVFNPEDKHDDA